jgi:hypothetical protein
VTAVGEWPSVAYALVRSLMQPVLADATFSTGITVSADAGSAA